MILIHMIFLFLLLAHVNSSIQSKAGYLGKDDLLHWGNGNFNIARSQYVLGEELILIATVFSEEFEAWGSCEWKNTLGEIWNVGEDVTDSDGTKVEGVEPFIQGPDTCGIKIASALQYHSGGWVCIYSNSVYVHIDTEDSQSSGLRLPETFAPIHYDVELTPELNSTKEPYPGQRTMHKFTGKVAMTVDAIVDTPDFKFHSDELTFKKISVTNPNEFPIQTLNISSIDIDFQRTFITLHLETTFKADSQYEIVVHYEANLDRGYYFDYGFYHRPCSDETNKHCWFTQFESTNARNAFPCLDEPGFKATFNVQVGRNEEYHSLSNMPLKETLPMEDKAGWFLDVYETSVAMSPYLMAVAVTDYKPIKSATGNTTVWAPKEDIDASRADYAIEIAPKIIKFYEEYFQVKYTLPKMDLVFENHKGSAMENWGLILFDQRALLFDPETGNEDSKFVVLSVIAHEIAHQWFGNLVTTNWWSQTWLNEGFATFASFLASENVDPKMNSWARLYVTESQRVMFADEDTSSHWAMTDDVTDRNDIERKFGMFTYQKGGSVIRMMEQMLSRETFTKGLTSYLTSSAYSAPTEDDLFFHLEEAALADGKWPQVNGPEHSFAEVMKGWTNQAGLPVIHARKTEDAVPSLYFNQSWLVRNEAVSEERRWDVPLTFTTVEENPQRGWDIGLPQGWISHDQSEVTIEADASLVDVPFVVNIQGTGYYRVNYDDSNWKAIAEVLRTNRDLIHPMNRAQIICDVMALSGTGHVSMEVMDDVLGYQDMETDYAPLYAFSRCLSGFKDEDNIFERI